MSIKEEFFKRLDRTYQRAQETAQVSTRNRDAWKQQVEDLAIMRRLLKEAGLFLEGSERKAQTVYYTAVEQAEVDIDQAEDTASTKTMAENAGLFTGNDVGTVKELLMNFDPAVFAEAWKRIPAETRIELVKAIGVEK